MDVVDPTRNEAYPIPTLFTLYAFINLMGYDDENNRQSGMHPVRLKVREKLERFKDTDHYLRWEGCYQETIKPNFGRWLLSAYAIVISPPPSFSPPSQFPKFEFFTEWDRLAFLPPLLNEFYQEAGVKELWEEALPHHQRIADLVLPDLKKLRHEVEKRVDFELPPHQLIFVPNLLESYHRGAGFFFQGQGDDTVKVYTMVGPKQKDKDYLYTTLHEYLHFGMHKVVSDHYLDKLDSLLHFLDEANPAKRRIQAEEHLVRRLQELMTPQVLQTSPPSGKGTISKEDKNWEKVADQILDPILRS